MPRYAREYSATGIYHVMFRGNGKQDIFEDDADRLAFISRLETRVSDYLISVLAWCLMDNHVHLLIHDEKGILSVAMQSLATSYALYFNAKCGRRGHLFENRFESVPVRDERQLLCAVRYIHNNPVELGTSPAGYRWSSYREYLGTPGLADTSLVHGILGGADGFLALMGTDAPGPYDPFDEAGSSDDFAIEQIRLLIGLRPNTLAALPKPQRDRALIAIRNLGMRYKQISRLTGIGESTIYRICREGREAPPPEVSPITASSTAATP